MFPAATQQRHDKLLKCINSLKCCHCTHKKKTCRIVQAKNMKILSHDSAMCVCLCALRVSRSLADGIENLHKFAGARWRCIACQYICILYRCHLCVCLCVFVCGSSCELLDKQKTPASINFQHIKGPHNTSTPSTHAARRR